jgi:hypothetical protein
MDVTINYRGLLGDGAEREEGEIIEEGEVLPEQRFEMGLAVNGTSGEGVRCTLYGLLEFGRTLVLSKSVVVRHPSLCASHHLLDVQ